MTRVNRLKKARKRRLMRLALDRLEDTRGNTRRKLLVVIDKARHELGENEVTKIEKERSRVQWKLLFENPGFNHLSLEKLIKSEAVTSVVPSTFKDKAPEIVYEYVADIRKQILNYKKVLEETVDQKEEEIACECEGSSWKHGMLGHICTGDLTIVDDMILRTLLTKGPKYRTRRRLDWQKVWQEVERNLKEVAKE